MLDLDAIDRACQRHRVEHLRIFGSALTDRLNHGSSDSDFLVDSTPGNTNRFHDYVDLTFDLENITGHPVHLVDPCSVRKHYVNASDFGSARELHAA